MIALLQRVSSAQLSLKEVSKEKIAAIETGLLVLVAFSSNDNETCLIKMRDKLCKLRVFSDDTGRLNHSLIDIKAQCLLVSQFTLYADASRGNRPSFHAAAPREQAQQQYHQFVRLVQETLGLEKVQHGPFGADLAVGLVNDGPVTLWLDSEVILYARRLLRRNLSHRLR